MPATDFLNKALDDLATTLNTLTGIPAVRDPRNITPGCVLIGAPVVEPFTYDTVKMTIPVTVISSGPGNLDALMQLLGIVASVLGKNVAVTYCRPSNTEIGGVFAPSYDLTVEMQANAT